MKTIKKIILFIGKNPLAHIFVGVVVFASGLFETLELLEEEGSAIGLGSHHGVMMVGLWGLTRGLSDMVESFDYLKEAVNKE